MTANGASAVYKDITLILATALITFISTWILVGRDTVKREDFDKLQSEVIQLQIQLARISEHLGVPRGNEHTEGAQR